tara:strand:- start:384 stop:1472 length:1089 start_codon:yes stop_codon:yes gene_type:complete
MKNVLKIAVVLFTALSFSFANAGELSVTGNAKASYVIVSSDSTSGAQEQPNSLGVANEFTLKAGGELDNGMTFGYNIDIDGDTTQDDGSLFLDTGSLGKIMISISEGGLETSKKGILSATGDRGSDSAYDEGMFEEWSVGDANNVSYHLPADMLPFGIAASVAYAPSTVADANQSVNNLVASNTGAITAANNSGKVYTTGSLANAGRNFTQYQVSAAPIDGLALGASYGTFGGATGDTGQEGEGGAWYATYALNNVSLGYSKSYVSLPTARTAATYESVLGHKYSALIAVNDDLKVSYGVEKSEATHMLSTTADVEQEVTQIAAAYTTGGLTLAVSMNDFENALYTANRDVKATVFNVSMAF